MESADGHRLEIQLAAPRSPAMSRFAKLVASRPPRACEARHCSQETSADMPQMP